MSVKLPDQPRKHRWSTETIAAGDTTLSVWPSPDDTKTKVKRQHFLDTIAKVGNDPRVIRVERHLHDINGVVFLFHINDA